MACEGVKRKREKKERVKFQGVSEQLTEYFFLLTDGSPGIQSTATDWPDGWVT